MGAADVVANWSQAFTPSQLFSLNSQAGAKIGQAPTGWDTTTGNVTGWKGDTIDPLTGGTYSSVQGYGGQHWANPNAHPKGTPAPITPPAPPTLDQAYQTSSKPPSGAASASQQLSPAVFNIPTAAGSLLDDGSSKIS